MRQMRRSALVALRTRSANMRCAFCATYRHIRRPCHGRLRPRRGLRSGTVPSLDSNSSVLAHALETAQALGWAVLDATLSGCLAEAHDLGLDAVPTRPGYSAVTSLSAVERERAHPASLSATTGLGVMPLHTDGAYLREPPDFTLLEAVRVDPMEDTLLWHFSNSDVSDDALHGVFAVSGRGAPFAAHAIDSVGRIRFDPVCMRPRDRMARRAASWLSERVEDAHRHSWASRPGSVLVVDNRMTLHGRAAVTQGSSRELRRLMLAGRA